jgi:hypothetical protein
MGSVDTETRTTETRRIETTLHQIWSITFSGYLSGVNVVHELSESISLELREPNRGWSTRS